MSAPGIVYDEDRDRERVVELRHIGSKLFVDMVVIFVRPDLPVRDGPSVIGVMSPAQDQVLAVSRDLAEPGV